MSEMARYIDADELYKATQKRIAEANKARMAVVDDEFLDLINDAFTEDVAPRAEWIRVDERLPERWKYVIVCDECKDVGVARHLGNGHFEWTDDENIAFATHWMPLPEPPKGG